MTEASRLVSSLPCIPRSQPPGCQGREGTCWPLAGPIPTILLKEQALLSSTAVRTVVFTARKAGGLMSCLSSHSSARGPSRVVLETQGLLRLHREPGAPQACVEQKPLPLTTPQRSSCMTEAPQPWMSSKGMLLERLHHGRGFDADSCSPFPCGSSHLHLHLGPLSTEGASITRTVEGSRINRRPGPAYGVPPRSRVATVPHLTA
uniref:uncharacterized protein LOC118154516 n=1 Tax=Callithrix jacchus TaxID=9483 RepID=UPI00159F5A85|nr:uncharacterized protein LOC118154516 [Callithrix jacchus]